MLDHALNGVVDIEAEDCTDGNSEVENPKMTDEEKGNVEQCVDDVLESHFAMANKIAVAHNETYLDSDSDSTEAMDTDSPSKVSPSKKASPSKNKKPGGAEHSGARLGDARPRREGQEG